MNGLQTALLWDTAGLCAGAALDLMFGDPVGRLHPVCLIGRLVSALERRALDGGGELSEREKVRRGARNEVWVVAATALVTGGLLTAAILLHPLFGLAAGALLADSALAGRDLARESGSVYRALRRAEGTGNGGLEEARRAVSRIVGRDVAALDARGIARAAVETVAENTSDGVIAPLFYLAIGGPVLGMAYKAVNTMDSMLGYRNERYLHYGRAAARTDDAANLLPARCAGLYLWAAAFLLRLDHKGALRIMARDARRSESPNAGYPEAAVAGALGLRLLGDASYFGTVKRRPFIGDATREIVPEDILAANRLMLCASSLAFLDVLFLRLFVFLLAGAVG